MNNFLLRLRWHRKRLSSMSFLEILHRFKEQWKRIVSRSYIPNLIYDFDKNLSLPKLPGIGDGLNNFQNNDKLVQEWRDLAKSTINKHFQFLGIDWPDISTSSIWHLDPISKKQWPYNTYCFQINYRNTKEFGDVKYVWELNRLQYLQPLAALSVLDKNEQLAKFCLSEIEDWIDNNSPTKGINWASGIELACRVVSILIVISLVDDSLFTSQQKNKIHMSLAFHGYWLMRFPSRYSSANNHLIAEASALYLLGKLAPYMLSADKWRAYGKKTLIKEVSKQIYEDGVGAEQSPTYTAFTLEWLLLCGIVGKQLDDDFPHQYWHRIEKAGEFIRWLTDKRGNQPRIGDDDEGKVIYSQISNELYVTSILSCIASSAQRKDLSPPVYVPHLREAVFGKTNYVFKPLQGVKCFKQGGYTISRTHVNDTEYLLVIDHGPLGYLSIAAHGHADALAIWLHINGFPILVDAGTYLYHSGGHWRDYMRSTLAHNTLSIDGKDSSQISGTFNWGTKANSILLKYDSETEYLNLIAEHDGYEKKFNARHRRQVQQHSNGNFIVKDSLHGVANELPVEIGFLIHPELKIVKQNNVWIIFQGNKSILKVESPTDYLKSSIKQGQQQPIQGWYSEEFNHIVTAPRLVFEGTLKNSTESIIHFKPTFSS